MNLEYIENNFLQYRRHIIADTNFSVKVTANEYMHSIVVCVYAVLLHYHQMMVTPTL